MKSRAEITTKFARAYAKASKADKGRILDQVVQVTGWSRDNARRRLVAAAARPPGSGHEVAARPRKPRTPKFSYDAVKKVLQRVWAASGDQCGKYLAASMAVHLDALERHGELVDGKDRYSPAVCARRSRRERRPASRGRTTSEAAGYRRRRLCPGWRCARRPGARALCGE